jgi:hypothetical protein
MWTQDIYKMVFYYETNIFLSHKFAVFSFVKKSLLKYWIHHGTRDTAQSAVEQGTLLSSTKCTKSECNHHKTVTITIFHRSSQLDKQVRKWSTVQGLTSNLHIKCRETVKLQMAILRQDRVPEMLKVKREQFPLHMPWRHIKVVEVQLHSFLTLELQRSEWLATQPSHFTTVEGTWSTHCSLALQPVRMFQRRDKSPAPVRIQTPDPPLCSLVIPQTTLSCLLMLTF